MIYRRTTLGLALFLLHVAQGNAAPTTTVQAGSAIAFLDSIGMNTHLGAPDTGAQGTSYGNTQAIIHELDYIHVKHVRDSLFIGANLPKFESIYQRLGAKFDLVYDNYAKDGGPSPLNAAIANVQDHRTLIEAIEGPNEPDEFALYFNQLTGATAVVAAQHALYAAVKDNAKLASVPVYCPSLSYPAPGGMGDRFGNLADVCDYVPAHVYVENLTLGPSLPHNYLERWTAFPVSIAPGRPVVITEGGWSTHSADAEGVNEAVQAKYLLTYLLDAFTLGIKRTYVYELADEDVTANYGLFRYDGTPKPAATMLSNLNVILGDGSPPSGSLVYSVTGLPATGHQTLLRKSDGTFVLALWNEAYLWNRKTKRESASSTVQVTLTFEAPDPLVQVFDPLEAATPQAPGTTAQQVTLSISDHPLLVLVKIPAAP